MCLNCFNSPTIHTATTDIVVYKVLAVKKTLGIFKSYHAPYNLSFKYSKGKIAKSDLFVNNDESGKYVEIGLHSFASLEDTHLYNKYHFYPHFVYAKLIIPKGARFVVGNTCGYLSYASDQLKLIKILHDY